jgi:hypothetical protein
VLLEDNKPDSHRWRQLRQIASQRQQFRRQEQEVRSQIRAHETLFPEAKALLRENVLPNIRKQALTRAPEVPNAGARPGQRAPKPEGQAPKPEGAKPKPAPQERVPVPQRTPEPQATPATQTNSGTGKPREISLGLGQVQGHKSRDPFDNTPVLLDRFSRRVNAPYYRQWPGYENVPPGDFKQLGNFIRRNLAEADKIHFNLDRWTKAQYQKWLNQRARAKINSPDLTSFDDKVNGITSWEYNTIINDPDLLRRTVFYGPGGKIIPHDQLPRHVVGGTGKPN